MIRFSQYLLESNLIIPDRKDTLDIDRKDMPQVAGKDYNHFFSYLNKNNILYSEDEIEPSLLKASQGHFHKEKIKKIMQSISDGDYKNKPILTSKDNYVMDGHHRWIAHNNLNIPIKIHKIHLNSSDLIDIMNTYPRSFKEKLYA